MSKIVSSPLINLVFKRQRQWRYSQYSLFWAALNVVTAFVLYMDIRYLTIQQYFEVSYPALWYTEVAFFLLFCFNSLVDLTCWVWPYIMTGHIELTPTQKNLLGVKDTDPGFKISPVKPAVSTSPIQLSFSCSPASQSHSYPGSHTPPGAGSSMYYTPSTGNKSGISPGSSPLYPSTVSSPGSTSFHTSMPNGSYSYRYGSNQSSPSYLSTESANQSLNASGYLNDSTHYDSPNRSGLRSRHIISTLNTSGSPFEHINDRKSLTQYLREEEEKENRNQLSSPENLSNSSTSFWNYGRTLSDHTHVLRKYQYQIATRTPQSSTTTRDTSQESCSYSANEVWNRLHVTESNLYTWTERMRKWLALTILAKLAEEIPNINKTVKSIGSEDSLIGEVSIATLKQVVLTKGSRVPTLNSVIPYLDLTSNQEYLVKRISDLGKDGCMSEFSWNRGGCYGKEWGEHLPNDASLVMHLFGTYMDSRLPVHPKYPDQRTFTSQYVMKTPNKPDLNKKDNLYIYQTSINPPHFQVIIGEHVWNLPKGRNNMFQALLMFLYHIKTKEHGMLGRVNLGLSGVNILWILN